VERSDNCNCGNNGEFGGISASGPELITSVALTVAQTSERLLTDPRCMVARYAPAFAHVSLHAPTNLVPNMRSGGANEASFFFNGSFRTHRGNKIVG